MTPSSCVPVVRGASSRLPRAVTMLAAVAMGVGVVPALTVTSPVTPSPAQAAPHRHAAPRVQPLGRTLVSRPVRIATGVSLQTYRFRIRVGHYRALPQGMIVLNVALSSRTRLVPVANRGVVGADRTTTTALARMVGAVGGVNGDFFDLRDVASAPRGGLMRSGVVLKSARPDTAATLYTTSDNRVHVGNPGFHGSLTARSGAVHGIWGTNNLLAAIGGGLTLVDSRVMATTLPPDCTVITLADASVHTTVLSVRPDATIFPRVTAGRRALVGCGASSTWIRNRFHAGYPAVVRLSHRVRGLTSYLGGGRVLVQRGRTYHDTRYSVRVPERLRNPLTFACVAPGGRTVRLGVVDGRSRSSAGMTYNELRRWVQPKLRCWSLLTFDGGGSTTLVARRPGDRVATVINKPSDGRVRRVPNGLFVVSR